MRLTEKEKTAARSGMLACIEGPMAKMTQVEDGRSFAKGVITAVVAFGEEPSLIQRIIDLLPVYRDAGKAAASMLDAAVVTGIELRSIAIAASPTATDERPNPWVLEHEIDESIN